MLALRLAWRPRAGRYADTSHRIDPIPRDLISLTPPIERALLVGAPRKGTSARHHVDDHLAELEQLADTAGAGVVGNITQQIDRPNPATYLGKGKIEERGTRIAEPAATLIIFQD